MSRSRHPWSGYDNQALILYHESLNSSVTVTRGYETTDIGLVAVTISYVTASNG